MRVKIEYEENGRIKSISGAGPDVTATRVPRLNHKLVDVEAPDVLHDRDFEGMKKLVENHRVVGHPSEPRLERK